MSQFVFFGTPEFAKIILAKLITTGYIPTAVVTNPDKPVGRKKIVTSPPVKKLIYDLGFKIQDEIKILQPETTLDLKSKIINLKSDFGIVASYSKIIPKEIISSFKLGIIGVHPSLLPKYRGASPIQSTILSGEKETGVTLYLIDEKVDHGSILTQAKIAIDDNDNYDSLLKKLAELSGDLLVKTLPDFLAGNIKPQEQDHAQATFTKKFETQDGFVDPVELADASDRASLDKAEIILRKIKALNPEPGAYTIENDKRKKLLDAEIRDGKLILKKIQWESKGPQIL